MEARNVGVIWMLHYELLLSKLAFKDTFILIRTIPVVSSISLVVLWYHVGITYYKLANRITVDVRLTSPAISRYYKKWILGKPTYAPHVVRWPYLSRRTSPRNNYPSPSAFPHNMQHLNSVKGTKKQKIQAMSWSIPSHCTRRLLYYHITFCKR